jgi:hypothetical protein
MYPLEGLKVVELARVLAGPWIGQTLADLGAEVIKVESPEGDDTRKWGPNYVTKGTDSSAAYFHSANRGKQGITVDFNDPARLAYLKDLIASADVLIENFKVGGLAKFGLDYASLAPQNPQLVYCSVTGFGQDGPRAQKAGYDFMIQGMTGIMEITGEPDGMPQKVGRRLLPMSSPGFTGSSAYKPPWPNALGRARGSTSIWHCLTACWPRRPIKTSITSPPGKAHSGWAMPIPASCPIKCFLCLMAISSSLAATIDSFTISHAR